MLTLKNLQKTIFTIAFLASTTVLAATNPTNQLFLPNKLAWKAAPKELPAGTQVAILKCYGLCRDKLRKNHNK